MFDAHCHLDFEAFDEDRDAVLERAARAGVDAMHVPGVAPAQWRTAAALCTTRDGFGSGVGLHPWWLARLSASELSVSLDGLAESAKRLGAEAIGECGLDAPLAKRGGPSLDQQVRVLDVHLLVARALRLPIVLHVVGAHGRALATLRRHGILPAGGMLHSYSGSAELVAPYADLGMYFSFGGVLTRPTARRPQTAALSVPVERLLLESDGPDQPLAGHERSAPEDIVHICAALASLRGEPAERVAEETASNAARLFQR